MQQTYDLVLIGAGPAAVAALAALPKGMRVAVLTGERFSDERAKVHFKIRAESYERQEIPGTSRVLPFSASRGAKLFDTAVIGGLANYWGQQFVRYAKNDPWPRDIFTNYLEYETACARIEALFVTCPTASLELSCGYVARTPTLVVGASAAPTCGLLAMRQTFLDLASMQNVEVIPAVALSWKRKFDCLRLHLSDGATLVAKRLLLAAGVVGSLRLGLASCADLKIGTLQDHAPYMLYAVGVGKEVQVSAAEHFNTLTLERITQSRSQLFASVYQLSKAPLSLLIAALGCRPILRGMRPPRLVDVLTPIQIWTEVSRMKYRIEPDRNRAALIARSDPSQDRELTAFKRWLSRNGTVLNVSMTSPGEGFHYHAGEVSINGSHFMPLASCLNERFAGLVTCVDASIFPEIGCRPHTLTAMAAAWQLTRKKIQPYSAGL